MKFQTDINTLEELQLITSDFSEIVVNQNKRKNYKSALTKLTELIFVTVVNGFKLKHKKQHTLSSVMGHDKSPINK